MTVLPSSPTSTPAAASGASPSSPSATAKTDRRTAELKKACQDFEAIFIQSLFKSMRRTVIDSGLFEKDTSHEIYQDMLDGEIAREVSRRQSMGLADQMYRQMEKLLPGKKNVKNR